MKTYIIPKGSCIYRGCIYSNCHEQEGELIGHRWFNVVTDKKVIYTNIDLRIRNKITDSDYYEFNLPHRAKPYDIIAAHKHVVVVSYILPNQARPIKQEK